MRRREYDEAITKLSRQLRGLPDNCPICDALNAQADAITKSPS